MRMFWSVAPALRVVERQVILYESTSLYVPFLEGSRDGLSLSQRLNSVSCRVEVIVSNLLPQYAQYLALN